MTDSSDMQRFLEQEKLCRFKSFDYEDAWNIGVMIRTKAASLHAPIALEIFAYGKPVFLCLLPGAQQDNLVWVKRKRNTVLRTGHSSLYMGLFYKEHGIPMDQQTQIEQGKYCDHGGGFPLTFENGNVFGAVTISGLPAIDDHDMVFQGLVQYQHLKSA